MLELDAQCVLAPFVVIHACQLLRRLFGWGRCASGFPSRFPTPRCCCLRTREFSIPSVSCRLAPSFECHHTWPWCSPCQIQICGTAGNLCAVCTHPHRGTYPSRAMGKHFRDRLPSFLLRNIDFSPVEDVISEPMVNASFRLECSHFGDPNMNNMKRTVEVPRSH